MTRLIRAAATTSSSMVAGVDTYVYDAAEQGGDNNAVTFSVDGHEIRIEQGGTTQVEHLLGYRGSAPLWYGMRMILSTCAEPASGLSWTVATDRMSICPIPQQASPASGSRSIRRTP